MTVDGLECFLAGVMQPLPFSWPDFVFLQKEGEIQNTDQSFGAIPSTTPAYPTSSNQTTGNTEARR